MLILWLCPTLPPDKTVTCDDAYTARFRASYIGKLTNIEYQNGAFTAMFGNSKIVAKLDVLPEWVQENVYAGIRIS